MIMDSFKNFRRWAVLFRIILVIYAFNVPSTGALANLRNVTIDAQHPSIHYAPPGAWNTTKSTPLDYGGSHMLTEEPNGTASFNFTGVAIYFMSPLWPYTVNTAISLDSGPPTLVDLVDHSRPSTDGGPETVKYHVVWKATGLANTQHHLLISVGVGQPYAIVDGLIYTEATDVESSSSSSLSPTSTLSTSSTSTFPSSIIAEPLTPTFPPPIIASSVSTFSSSIIASSTSISAMAPSTSNPTIASSTSNPPITSSASLSTTPSSIANAIAPGPSSEPKHQTSVTEIVGPVCLGLFLLLLISVVLYVFRRQRRLAFEASRLAWRPPNWTIEGSHTSWVSAPPHSEDEWDWQKVNFPPASYQSMQPGLAIYR